MSNDSSVDPRGSGRDERSRRTAADERRAAKRPRSAEESSPSVGARGAGESYRLSDPTSRRRGALEAAPARLHIDGRRGRSRAKRIVLTVAGSLLALLCVGAATAVFFALSVESTVHGTSADQKSLKSALTAVEPKKPFNVLILGADYRPGDKRYRSDSMMVAHVDPKLKRVWLVSIPRDTRVEIAGHGAEKINAARFIGGPEGAIKATEGLTGLKMNHYIEMNFVGFKDAVDALGGVWVDVPVTIDDEQADNTPGNRASHIDAGYQLLDGDHALTFTRARHQFADQDLSRIRNQQLFMKALADQIAETSSISRIANTVSAVTSYLRTDMSLVEMVSTAQALKAAGGKSLYTATAKGEWKSPYIYPDEVHIAELVADIEAKRPFEGAAAAGAVSGAKPAKNHASVSVTVHNGSGNAGVAKQVASILAAQGFRVGEVGNANQSVYEKTLFVYKNSRADAESLASVMPGTRIVQSRGMYSFTTDVLVVVGKDWDVSKVPVTSVKAGQ